MLSISCNFLKIVCTQNNNNMISVIFVTDMNIVRLFCVVFLACVSVCVTASLIRK